MHSQVRIEKLNDTNYAVWVRLIRAHLVERDLAGTLSESSSSTSEEHAKAVAIITLHVSPHLLHLVDSDMRAHKVLETIKKHFSGKNTVRLVQLKRDFATLRMQGRESISQYYNRAIELRDIGRT